MLKEYSGDNIPISKESVGSFSSFLAEIIENTGMEMDDLCIVEDTNNDDITNKKTNLIYD